MTKLLFSMIDCRYPIPGPLQHMLIRDFASRNNFSLGFYGAEDPEFSHDSPYLLSKLDTLGAKYQGIVFFDLLQLRGNAKYLLNTILERDFVLAFVVQDLVIETKDDLRRHLILMESAFQSVRSRNEVLIIRSLLP